MRAYQISVPYLLLMAAVARIPRLAESVTAIGFESNWVQSGALRVFVQRQ